MPLFCSSQQVQFQPPVQPRLHLVPGSAQVNAVWTTVLRAGGTVSLANDADGDMTVVVSGEITGWVES